jgi:hypothetical protein
MSAVQCGRAGTMPLSLPSSSSLSSSHPSAGRGFPSQKDILGVPSRQIVNPFPAVPCRHRWSALKRWDKDGVFSAIQKCRRCQTWKRTDVAMSKVKDRLDVDSVIYDEHITHSANVVELPNSMSQKT